MGVNIKINIEIIIEYLKIVFLLILKRIKYIIENGIIINNPSYLIKERIAAVTNAKNITFCLSLKNNKIDVIPKKMNKGSVKPVKEF